MTKDLNLENEELINISNKIYIEIKNDLYQNDVLFLLEKIDSVVKLSYSVGWNQGYISGSADS